MRTIVLVESGIDLEEYCCNEREMAASPQRFMAPPMDVRLHGSTPEGGETILTPEALR